MSTEEQTSTNTGGADDGRIRVAVSGARGRMGVVTCSAVSADPELLLAAEVDPAFRRADGMACFATLAEAIDTVRPQVVVDFTIPAVVRENVITCVRRRVPAVVGTTGLSADDLAEIRQEAEANDTPVLVAPNFAMGAVLMMRFARQAAQYLHACEIVELHHEKKLDAPSGTSRLTRLHVEESWLEAGLEREVPIHSVRLPGLVAHQEVVFGGVGETLTIRHDTVSRESFMPGVLLAVKHIRRLQGLVVGLENII